MAEVLTHALVRPPPSSYANGITTVNLGAPDYKAALQQHAGYVAALQRTGLEVIELPPLDGFPDSCFVEDTAVIVDHQVIATMPGAKARRGEVASVVAALADYLQPAGSLTGKARLDGGDVLEMEQQLFVGLTERTDDLGVEQLRELAKPLGHTVTPIEVRGILHLKTGCTRVAPGTVCAHSSLAPSLADKGFKIIVVPASEAYAANCLRINDHLIMPAGYPDVRALLANESIVDDAKIIEVEMSEFAKQDGGLTCLSRLW